MIGPEFETVEEEDSISADIKRKFVEFDLFKDDGTLSIKRLEEAFRNDDLDIETFKQAIK